MQLFRYQWGAHSLCSSLAGLLPSGYPLLWRWAQQKVTSGFHHLEVSFTDQEYFHNINFDRLCKFLFYIVYFVFVQHRGHVGRTSPDLCRRQRRFTLIIDWQCQSIVFVFFLQNNYEEKNNSSIDNVVIVIVFFLQEMKTIICHLEGFPGAPNAFTTIAPIGSRQ